MKEHEKFSQTISKRTGLTIEQIKEKSPEELKEYLVSKNKKPFTFKPYFPFIGRGCPIREFKTTEEIDKELDEFLIS